MKTCTKCGGEPKPLSEFGKRASASDGLRSQCKACDMAANAKWKSANKAHVMAYSVEWRAANPEKSKASVYKWRADNPEAMRIINHNYRASKRNTGGKLSAGLAERLFKLQRGKCACGCKQPLGDDYHSDHIMPLALGGTNTDDNMQLLRATCNQQKYSKHPIDFMQQRGFLL